MSNIVSEYFNGNFTSKVLEDGNGQFIIELYKDNRLLRREYTNTLPMAEDLAENFVFPNGGFFEESDGPQFLG